MALEATSPQSARDTGATAYPYASEAPPQKAVTADPAAPASPPLDAETLATIGIDPGRTGPVDANSPAGTVVGTVTITIDGQRVDIADLPPDQLAQITLSIQGGNGAYALNDKGQLIVVDPSLLNTARLDAIRESIDGLLARWNAGTIPQDLFFRQMQTLQAAAQDADPTRLSLTISYGGTTIAAPDIVLEVNGLQAPVPTPASQPEPPYTAEDIEAITANGSTYFFEALAQQPEGSKGAILYNLFRARSIGDLSEFEGKVDIVGIEADIHDLLADPEIQALMTETQDIAALQQTQKTSDELASEMSAYLLDDATIAWMQTLPPAEREAFIEDRIHEIAFFDPGLAKSTMESLTGEIIQYELDTKTLADYAPAEVEQAVSSLFQIAIVGNRFGVGLLGAGAGALAELSAADYKAAVSAYTAHLQAGGSPSSFRGSPYAGGLTSRAKAALFEFSDGLNASGATGAVGSVLAAIAVYQDFSGGQFPDTPIKVLNTTADLMSMLGGLPGMAKAFKFLGLDTATLGALQGVARQFGVGGLLGGEALEGALQGVDMRDSAAVYKMILEDPEAYALFTTDAAGNPLTAAETDAEIAAFAQRMESVAERVSFTDGTYDDFLANMSEMGQADDPLLAEFMAADFEAIAVEEAGDAIAAGAVAVDAALEPAVATGMMVGSAIEGSVITAYTVLGIASVFEGMSLLGAAAELFYGAESFAYAEAAFQSGDTTAGWLNIAAGLSFEVSGVAGIGAYIGSVWGVAALSGPLLPFVALGTGVAAFGAVLTGQFHAKHKHQEQIDALDEFLISGVGNGKDYYLPDQHRGLSPWGPGIEGEPIIV